MKKNLKLLLEPGVDLCEMYILLLMVGSYTRGSDVAYAFTKRTTTN